MIDVVAIAMGVISPLGVGEAGLSEPTIGAIPRVMVRPDEALAAAGLSRTAAARVLRGGDGRSLLARALHDCVADLSRSLPQWRTLRVGLALGTSSGDMAGAERAYESLARGLAPATEHARALAYGLPFAVAARDLGMPLAREAHVLGACASSTLACGLAQIWLSSGECDVVLAGGYDELTLFVSSGFVALGAVTGSRPRPFRVDRDGLALGEGAAVIALVRPDDAILGRRRLVVAGFGASSDAVHVTAPDPSGAGVRRASERALTGAGFAPEDLGAASLHGTATAHNDAAEWAGLASLLGDSRAAALPVHAMKGEIGHLFGAAGLVEALTIHAALEAGVALPSGGGSALDPRSPAHVLDVAEPLRASLALKTSLAFGGLNAALVLAASPRPDARGRARDTELLSVEGRSRELSLSELAEILGAPLDRLARCDALTRSVLDAIADLRAQLPPDALDSAGIIVGHDVANVATNALFAQRLYLRGAALVEPRRFPFTSPNACAGEAAIRFGLRGPAFAVGGFPGGESQALDVARDLVAAGQCPSAIVVEVTEESPAGLALFAAWRRAPGPPGARARLVRAASPAPVVGSAASE